MKVLLLATTWANDGPSAVHRQMVRGWPEANEINVLHSASKVGRMLEGMWKGVHSDVVIIPGVSWTDIATHRLLGLFHVPVVCFNHGYVPFENEVNGFGYSKRKIEAIQRHMLTSQRIVCNSRNQKELVARELPESAPLLSYALLGVDRFELGEPTCAISPTIVSVSGGTRPIKANDVVARAVALLRSRGINCMLRVYGHRYAANAALEDAMAAACGEFVGQVSQDEFIEGLRESAVFVMNSRHESFGLSALDALRAGCSLLLSENCGVAETLELQECDIVQDCEDAKEVANKIANLMSHPNFGRLYQSIDFEGLSWERFASEVRLACVEVTKSTHSRSARS